MSQALISVDEVLYGKSESQSQTAGYLVRWLVRRQLEELVSREPEGKPWMAYTGMVDAEDKHTASVDDIVHVNGKP